MAYNILKRVLLSIIIDLPVDTCMNWREYTLISEILQLQKNPYRAFTIPSPLARNTRSGSLSKLPYSERISHDTRRMHSARSRTAADKSQATTDRLRDVQQVGCRGASSLWKRYGPLCSFCSIILWDYKFDIVSCISSISFSVATNLSCSSYTAASSE